MQQPLAGVKVLELTQFLAGPYAGMILADLGADVLKIERPGRGEVYRTYGPKFINGESTSYLAVNRNKKSLALDLKRPEAAEIIFKLVDEADVLIENFRPGTLDRLGFGWETLRQRNPRLIYCALSGFGSTGPYRERGGFDLVLQGMGGLMSVTGEADGPPVKAGYPVADMGAGLYAALGVMAAYIRRVRTGEGGFVDTSLLEAVVAWSSLAVMNYLADGELPGRLGSASPQNAPYQAFPTSDGYINVGTGNDELWKRFCDAIGLPELPHDERFIDNPRRVANQHLLSPLISERTKLRSTKHWLAVFEDLQIPCGPVYEINEMLEDPQVLARDMVMEMEHPTAGVVRGIGFPVKISETGPVPNKAAPMLGQNSVQVLRHLGYNDDAIEQMAASGLIGIGDAGSNED